MSEIEALRDERNHWIGEAKKFERLWKSADERATRWFLERNEAREAIERVEALADEWSSPESHRANAWVRERDAADRIRAALAKEDAR